MLFNLIILMICGLLIAISDLTDFLFSLVPAVPAWITTACEQIGANGAYLLSTLGSAGADLAGLLAWALRLVVVAIPLVLFIKVLGWLRGNPGVEYAGPKT